VIAVQPLIGWAQILQDTNIYPLEELRNFQGPVYFFWQKKITKEISTP
jgi:hypothetical protein